MRVPFLSARSTSVLLIAVLATFGVGCGKYRTKFSLDRAKKMVVQAEQYEAEQFVPEELQRLRDQINQAEDAMNRGDYASSVPSAGQAVDQARSLVDNVRARRATELQERSQQDLEVLRANDGPRINPELFAEVQDSLERMADASSRARYDDVISHANDVRRNTEIILEGLRQQAENGRRELLNQVEDMRREEAPTAAPQFMTQVNTLVTEINQLIDDQRLYRDASAQIELARSLAIQGITEARRQRSQVKLQRIQAGLREAAELGAGEQYAIDFHNQCEEKYAELFTAYESADYPLVLDAADLLEENVAQLIVQTKREGAHDVITQSEALYSIITDGGALDYDELRPRAEQIQQQIRQANTEFDNTNYDEAKNLASAALDAARSVETRLDAMAADHLRAAEDAYAAARSVLDRAREEGFFIQRPEAEVQPIDRPFEQTKGILFDEISANLTGVTRSIEAATQRRSDQQYRTAIQTADGAREAAEEVVTQVQRVSAHNALVELASKAKHVEQDGAGQYARTELAQVEAEVGRMRQLIQTRDYRQAIDHAADVRASLENTVAKLHAETLRMIREALEQERLAEVEGVSAARPDQARLAEQLIKQASESLGASPPIPLESNQIIYSRAIQQINEAQDLFVAMRTEINREKALAAMDRSAKLVGDAEGAGASIYAGEPLRDAQARMSQARALEHDGQYLDARRAAEQAEELAATALYKRVVEADEAITNARLYRGWDFKHSELAQAIIDNRNARIAIDNGLYEEGNRLAQVAAERADRLISFSQERDFQIRVREMMRMISESLRVDRVGLFQPVEARQLIADLRAMEETFTAARYDEYNLRLARLEGRVEDTLRRTPDLVEATVRQQREYIDRLEELGARDVADYEIGLARNMLGQVLVDYRSGAYRESYSELRKAVQLVNSIAGDVANENYRVEATRVLRDLGDIMTDFRMMINMRPMQLKGLVTGFHASGQLINFTGQSVVPQWHVEDGVRKMISRDTMIDPVQFADRVSNLYARAQTIQPHSSQRHLHNKLMETLHFARQAGRNFEQFLIIDQFSQSKRFEIIDAAYDYLEKMRKGQSELSDRFFEPHERFRPDVEHRPLEELLPVR